jgi:hypothetical protein
LTHKGAGEEDMSELKIWWRLFVYNYFKRHWNNFLFRKYRREWIASGRNPAFFPRAGKISREAWDWAQQHATDLTNPPEPKP